MALFGKNDILHLTGAKLAPPLAFLGTPFSSAEELPDRPTSICVTGALSVFSVGAWALCSGTDLVLGAAFWLGFCRRASCKSLRFMSAINTGTQSSSLFRPQAKLHISRA